MCDSSMAVGISGAIFRNSSAVISCVLDAFHPLYFILQPFTTLASD